MGRPTVLALLLLTLVFAVPAWSVSTAGIGPEEITDVHQDGTTGTAGFVSLKNSNELLRNCWACGELYLSTCCDFPIPVFTQDKIYIRFTQLASISNCIHSATLSLKKFNGSDPTASPLNIINVRSVDWDGSPLDWESAAALTMLSAAPPQNFVFSKTDSTYSLSIPTSFLEAALDLPTPFLALEIELNNGRAADVSTLFYSSANQTDLSVQFSDDCGSNSHCYSSSCVCDTGYSALSNGTCTPTKNCARLGKPCGTHGTCSEVSAPNLIGAVNCSCAASWFGAFCDVNAPEDDVNECRYLPCQNGGNCTNTVGSFTCDCPLGWSGDLCDEPVFCESVIGYPPTRAGQTAVGVCPSGTTSSSPPTRYCNENTLTLDPSPISCNPVSCAEVDSTSTTWAAANAGDESSGACNDLAGFEGSGATRMCDFNGNFSPEIDSPCLPKFCDAGSLDGASFPKTPAGVLAYGNCTDNSQFGSPTRQCQSDGQWGAVLNTTCHALQTTGSFCPPLVDSNGFILFPKSDLGTSVHGRCPPGQIGAPTKTCVDGDWANTISNPCSTLPSPVTNLKVKSQTSSTTLAAVTLTWTAGSGSPPTLFQVMYYDAVAQRFNFVNNGGGESWTGTSIDVEFLSLETTYVMVVYAGNAKGYESVGTMVSFTTNAAAIDSCNASTVGTTGASLTWAEVDGADWYTVLVRYIGPSASKRAITSTSYVVAPNGLKITTLSYTFTDLGLKSGYQAQVLAGKTINGVDSMSSTGIEVYFNTAGYVAPTPRPTSLPTSEPTATPPGTDIVPYVAGGVGGAVALLLFVVILVAFFVRSKRKEKELYQLQMAELPPAEAWGQSATSLVSRAGGTQTLTRTHTLTRPNAGLDQSGAGLSLHSLNSTNGDMMFGADPTLMNTVMEISLPGFLLLDYAKDLRIVNRFGNGGSGVVYRAVLLDPKLRKQHNVEEVALKEVVAWEKLSNEENMERFHQEVSLLWSLAFHRNIATLIGYTDSPPTIVTKLYETDLFQFLQNPDEEVTTPIAVLLASQIAAGISGMHNIGIVHRDIKSANVLLETVTTQNGILLNACLCDFGLARVTATSKLFNQKFSTVVGLSPRYAAPEVFARSHLPTLVPDPEEEKKADVFAFGVIVWELMTRQVPWDDTPNEQIEVRVRSGKRLNMPPVNGDLLIQTMSDICTASWIEQPARRPNIQDVHKRLNSLEL